MYDQIRECLGSVSSWHGSSPRRHKGGVLELDKFSVEVRPCRVGILRLYGSLDVGSHAAVCALGIGEQVKLNEQQTFRKWW